MLTFEISRSEQFLLALGAISFPEPVFGITELFWMIIRRSPNSNLRKTIPEPYWYGDQTCNLLRNSEML